MFNDITDTQVLLKFGLILLLGFLVGIERGWSFKKKKEGQRTAGIRTFTLIALSGGLWGLLHNEVGDLLLGIAFLGFILIVMTGYYQHARKTGKLGLTTEMAAFLTFSLGIAVIKGYIVLPVSITILMVLLLSIKPELHKWVKTIEPSELYSGIVFLIISAILLPLLPNRGFGPWKVWNPFELWAMVVLIAGISYAGYFSMKYLGRKKGLLFTSFTGSLVSSLAVTVTLGRYGEKTKSTDILTTGILIATFTALGRVLLLVLLFNHQIFPIVAPSVAAMAITSLIAAVWLQLNSEGKTSSDRFTLKNPLQLSTAIQFGILLAVVMFLSELSTKWFGEPGIYGLSILSGMVDIDSITLTLLDMSEENLPGEIAAYGLILATITNTLVKAGIFTYFIGYKRAKKLLVICLIIALSSLPGFLI
ncbi:MgtC/SapB family protein [Balneolaceae bacterium YR4-1]|uniref:MgtC/SapB family protein n=1 Tax=Halalkalibaculum roseum TaxID=2709311 RepID=A0A6M1T8G6_9BACT|nr:MgtC/SapB family protein [Halalkalibaculum roseum]NGP76563.1 MgtC/SapB family protein [Halalkalibaculum roseum]